MPSTSVHFSASLLADLDSMAAETGTSRNRLIVNACEEAILKRKQWPEALFDDSRYSAQELEDLRSSARSFERDLLSARTRKDRAPW